MANDKEVSPAQNNAAFYGDPPAKKYRSFLNIAQPQDEPPGGPGYLKDHREKWIRETLNRVMQSQRFENSLASITNCLTPQVRKLGMDLAEPVTVLACMVVSKPGGGKKSLEKLWAIRTGKTWKALSEFPDRLRRFAKEIEQINASPFFAPATYLNTGKAEVFRKRFEQLPGIMSFYARGVEWRLAQITRHFAQAVPPTPKGSAPVILYLSYVVKLFTGKWRDKEVAELLNAAAVALGKQRQFDALNLAQARARFNKKPKS